MEMILISLDLWDSIEVGYEESPQIGRSSCWIEAKEK